MQPGQREIVLLGDRRCKCAKARYRLALGDNPGRDHERCIVAQRRPVDQRLPDRLLAGSQCRRVRRPIADEVGAGVIRGFLDDCFALRRDPVYGCGGEPCQWHACRPDFFFLGIPFFRDRSRQHSFRHDELALSRRFDGSAVEGNTMTAFAL